MTSGDIAGRGERLREQGQYQEALGNYEQALEVYGDCHETLHSQAWLLVHCPLWAYRDPERAIQRAARACELTGWKDDEYIDTLEAAYRQAGNLEAAANCRKKAAALAAVKT